MGRFVLGRNEVPVLLNWLGSIAVRTLKLVKTLLTGVGADLKSDLPYRSNIDPGMEADRVVVASPNTLDHSAKSRLVVIITLVCSYSLLSR